VRPIVLVLVLVLDCSFFDDEGEDENEDEHERVDERMAPIGTIEKPVAWGQ